MVTELCSNCDLVIRPTMFLSTCFHSRPKPFSKYTPPTMLSMSDRFGPPSVHWPRSKPFNKQPESLAWYNHRPKTKAHIRYKPRLSSRQEQVGLLPMRPNPKPSRVLLLTMTSCVMLGDCVLIRFSWVGSSELAMIKNQGQGYFCHYVWGFFGAQENMNYIIMYCNPDS